MWPKQMWSVIRFRLAFPSACTRFCFWFKPNFSMAPRTCLTNARTRQPFVLCAGPFFLFYPTGARVSACSPANDQIGSSSAPPTHPPSQKGISVRNGEQRRRWYGKVGGERKSRTQKIWNEASRRRKVFSGGQANGTGLLDRLLETTGGGIVRECR